MISWFYAYVEHIEIKTKTVNIIHFPYLDLSQNVKIRDVPYSLKSPIKVITKLPNSEQSYKGKVKTHNYINRQNQSTTGKL